MLVRFLSHAADLSDMPNASCHSLMSWSETSVRGLSGAADLGDSQLLLSQLTEKLKLKLCR